MNRKIATIAVGLVLLLSPVFSNQLFAYFRGDEYEQRDFTFNDGYFLNLLPLMPTIEDRFAFRDATNAYWGSCGSYTKRDLFNMQYLKLEKLLVDPFSFCFRFNMDQDFDGIYNHYQIGLKYDINPNVAVELLGEPLARKEFADIGGALILRHQTGKLRLELLSPNFAFGDKNDLNAKFQTQPFTTRFWGYEYLTPTFQVYAMGDIDYPSKTDYAGPEFMFDYESYKPVFGAAWGTTTNQMLWGELSSEYTKKSRVGEDLDNNMQDFRTERSVWIGRLEYVRHIRTVRRYSVGTEYVYFREHNDYDNDLEKTVYYKHSGYLFYATVRQHLIRQFYFSTGLYNEIDTHKEDYPYREEGVSDPSGYQGKVPLALEWISSFARISFGAAMKTEEVGFGGGFANAIVIF